MAFLQCCVAKGVQDCAPNTTKVVAVSLDVSKAFDSVPSNALLLELQQRWRVPPALLALLKSYLTNRSQVVWVEGAGLHTHTCSIGGTPGLGCRWLPLLCLCRLYFAGRTI